MFRKFKIFDGALSELENKNLLINTINAYSYNLTKKDSAFREALLNSDILIPDGIGAVWALRILSGKKVKKIAGADLFYYEMSRLQEVGGKCFFLGSTNETLNKIKLRASKEFPKVQIGVYSPPYKPVFSNEDTALMLKEVNDFKPDALFVGMTAPKQEKWSYENFVNLHVGHVCSIGAVFDFYAGTIKRAPSWMIAMGLEWLYRLLKEPKRLWKRYLIGNSLFIYYICKEKLFNSN